ncbi:TlpA family protein disulfide reductase [Fodinicola acaciae]|uniref:TlpA family protein disulfide reductase n=1 Tax=Fodinicola acaciae TaxID=2681555 RepID=UPI0013D5B344|nr:hypothetical protein [Fodinicola acaciae]
MPILAAAVTLVGVLCLVLLVLVFAVLRRLREQQAELEQLRKAVGMRLTDYDVSELLGRRIPDVTDTSPTLVGFFSVDCETCHEQAPIFAAALRGQRALAVISGRDAEDNLLALQFGDASVLAGVSAGEFARGLGIRAYPTFLRLDDTGTVVQAQTEAAGLAGKVSV